MHAFAIPQRGKLPNARASRAVIKQYLHAANLEQRQTSNFWQVFASTWGRATKVGDSHCTQYATDVATAVSALASTAPSCHARSLKS
jgi:hypothetical protein